MDKLGKNRKNVVSAFLLAGLLFSAVFVVLAVENLNVSPVYGRPHVLQVAISPSEAKLSPNQPQLFTASIENADEIVGEVSYSWSVEDVDGRFTRDGKFSDYAFTFDGYTAEFAFLSVTTHTFLLKVEAFDSQGSGTATAVIRDPYSASNIYIDDLGIIYDYIVESDGSGWYRYVDSAGQEIATDTTLNNVLTWACGNLTAGSVFLKEVAWDSSVTVPSNVMVVEQDDGVLKRYINSADSQGSPYTVSTDGTNYYCQDSAFSYINSFTSTNASYTFQSTIDALPDQSYPYGGGTIEFGYGTFTFTNEIDIDKSLHLVGQNRYGMTELTLDNSFSSTNFLHFNDPVDSGLHFVIERLWINGNKNYATATQLLYFQEGYVTMRDCYVMYGSNNGINVATQDNHFTNVYVEYCANDGWVGTFRQNTQIVSCTAWGNGRMGMYVANSYRFSITDCRIMLNGGEAGLYFNGVSAIAGGEGGGVVEGCYISENNGTGIYAYNARDLRIIGNEIRDNGKYTDNTYYGIRFNDGNNNTVIGNHICSSDDQAYQIKYGITEEGTSDDNIFKNNVMYGAQTLAINKIGSNTIVEGNKGFVTENEGSTQNVTSTTFSFNHGLAGTPDYIWASFNTTTVSGYSWTANATAIDITITGSGLPASITTYWKAKYIP